MNTASLNSCILLMESPFGVVVHEIIYTHEGTFQDLVPEEYNDAFQSIIGDAVLINQAVSTLDPFIYPHVVALYNTIVATNGKSEYEFSRPENGSWYSVKTHIHNSRLVAVFVDITQQKELEISEKEKSNRLRAIVNAMPDVIVTFRSNGDYVDISSTNPSARIFPDTDVSGKNLSDVFPPDLAALFLRSMRLSIDNQALQTVYFQFGTTNHIRYFENRFMPVDEDKVLSIVREVTESTLKDEKLRYQVELHRLMVEISNHYLDVSAGELDITLNDSLSKLGRFIGADRFFLIDYNEADNQFFGTHEWCADGMKSLINEINGVPVDRFEYWIEVHKKGDFHVIDEVSRLDSNDPLKAMLEAQDVKSMVAVPILIDGVYTGFLAIENIRSHKSYDTEEMHLLRMFANQLVTVRQRINKQQELETVLENLRESLRIKSSFQATISHELRTPLNHILGFGSLIHDQSTEKTIREYADELIKSGNDLLGIIEDMITLALAENSSLQLKNVSVKGVEIYSSAKDLLLGMLTQTGKNEQIKLIQQPDPGFLSMTYLLDRKKLQQALAVIFSNAVKFTSSGSIEFGVTSTINTVRLYVRDTGIGMPEEMTTQIFEAFRQLDDGLNRKYGGLGIGLSIAKKMIDVLGGTIEVESKVGVGSLFSIEIPLHFT
ncbi:MAG: ATP-binding protein [Paludibacter sp.]|nr:ATP-binding protein [Paludibacter sp.]